VEGVCLYRLTASPSELSDVQRGIVDSNKATEEYRNVKFFKLWNMQYEIIFAFADI
jgi:hypothetical protein